MTHITLKQLRYFDALVREQHFGRAADACSVTQPALSMQIQDLEASLGIALIERTRSGIKLTPKGEEIALRAQRMLNDVRNLIDYAQHAGGVLSGTLRLGVIPTVAPYLLPPLLPLLKENHSDLELYVRETQTQLLMDELSLGKLDVVLLALPIKSPDIETISIFNDRFLLAVPKGKKLSGRVRATNEMVESDRLLLLEEGHCLRDQALTYCSLKQVDAVNTFGASSLSTIVEMVSAGLGITLLPEICVGVEGRGREIKIMRFVEPEPSREIGLAWRRSSPRRDDFIALSKLVAAAAQVALKRAGTTTMAS
ncbi:LysR family transcriptional regulator [Hyphomicrobium methylovorum]|uniref:hydrogen peroxide-inducible genes activator n=1 Tax=Hyphomicrobium methylovorum TaxID=84 RepID=UPI0015E7C189|nr:hydrogen peroxide-inducible genes activator [Hyphomicrobium methylovorum]MBA2126815.1 LysR family transcriptional regulator [Hyphomicrobium methylovorum]